MPVPSQGYYGFPSFSVVDWFFLFIYIWVLNFPLEDCSELGNFVIILISCNWHVKRGSIYPPPTYEVIYIIWPSSYDWNWQCMVHKTKTSKTTIQHNMCCTSLYANKQITKKDTHPPTNSRIKTNRTSFYVEIATDITAWNSERKDMIIIMVYK